MSELKAYYVPTRSGNSCHCYLKDEADKVIADKDKEIQRLENLCESYRIDCDNLAIREANAYKEIGRDNKRLRHNKYKRCLAMAKWCEMCHRELLTRACLPTKRNWNRHDEWRYFVNFWNRYEYRFRKLAEKLKEANRALKED